MTIHGRGMLYEISNKDLINFLKSKVNSDLSEKLLEYFNILKIERNF